MSKWVEKWGAYALALVCACVVALSAIYTRQEDIKAFAVRDAASGAGQTLPQALAEQAAGWVWPVLGADGRMDEAPGGGASDSAGAFRENGLWRLEPFAYFQAAHGQTVVAMRAGEVVSAGDGRVVLSHAGGYASRTEGMAALAVKAGDRVLAGQRLGAAGGAIRVCVTLDGVYQGVEGLVGWE